MNSSFIFAVLLWNSIGFGFLIYGKKQKRIVPLIGGIILMAAPYVVHSTMTLSLLCIGVIAVIYYFRGV